ncbi:vinculin-like isoform X1 [Amphibalanus amphitrite]|uniref:vinculin-like isoform X1 n=1 Tax=Amphibalanus amphitrite TaxID=1232801 RepID=UPI001C8FF831|nr:vinculin-like isoform X1 [Amphibalanus amphitrite]XP_043244518.1 vinculin-like isoform X1 [Amphibalanus amphitrite]
MPVFHTKTIESILEPVAHQVSRLVILHEEAEDGNAMPNLERPVQAVSRAVSNLVKVGRETINSSDDPILRQDMPASLVRVEQASRLLEEASSMLKADPYSQPARGKLIDGSRGILQGTSSLLLCFDESEVRKIIVECKRVLDYLAVAEVIDTMEDLVQFVKDLSPCLTKVSRDVDAREKELTHQVHREMLIRCLEQVKTLAPILICSMKIYIQLTSHPNNKGSGEAAENRNYLVGRMGDEITEIIRVLQLTTYDEDEWDADVLTALRRAENAIAAKMQPATDWLQDPLAVRGGVGEKSLRSIVELSGRVADRALPQDRDAINKMAGDVTSMTDALCELRSSGQGTSPQAQGLARSLQGQLGDLHGLVRRAVANVERAGVRQPAHTLAGRLEQARRWLQTPDGPDRELGQRAIQLVVEEGRRAADNLSGQPRQQVLSLCDEVEGLSRQLADLVRRGQGNTPQAQALAKQLSAKLQQLKDRIQNALVGRVVEDFVDICTPLKQFTEATLAPEGTPGREQNFSDKADNLQRFSTRAARTGRMVASAGASGNKKLSEALQASANEVESLSPQLVNAGSIRLQHPQNRAADEHFENLRRQYAESISRVRDLSDEAIDAAKFIRQSEELMRKHTGQCEDGIQRRDPQQVVDNTSAIARLANRVLMVAQKEADNSEDPRFRTEIQAAVDRLQSSVTPMVQSAKTVAQNPADQNAAARWRGANQELLDAVGQVRKAVGSDVDLIPGMSQLELNDAIGRDKRDREEELGALLAEMEKVSQAAHAAELSAAPPRSETAPPRPPLPAGGQPPPRPPPPPETDDEEDSHVFRHAPPANQPIMAAAHGLHQEVAQWSSRDNDIIAAAKRMAQLMARLSQLVRGEGGGTKRDLIACAKAIAEASEEVTRLAKELGQECTDKRMRTQLLQVCERIPTIGTQLKILSTVKATMLGAHGADKLDRRADGIVTSGTEEDQEATDMLVGNAQNLMQSVKETVRAAEAASIKMRTDAGIQLRWVRKSPWYQ